MYILQEFIKFYLIFLYVKCHMYKNGNFRLVFYLSFFFKIYNVFLMFHTIIVVSFPI